ncbi:MAG: 50S ribosomal protein L11 methyltransferase [Bdellovibrionia bacterium]
MASTYVLRVQVAQQVQVLSSSQALDRDEFLGWVWAQFAESGLLGIHEGTLLSEQAAEQGYETDSWTVDSALAPRERDWVADQACAEVELYFASDEQAERAQGILSQVGGVKPQGIREQKEQDWDADWKASFLNAGAGVFIEPFWRIIPPWAKPVSGERAIRINPGAGFGTGTHETTQLCLKLIGESAQKRSLQGQRVLDFGSGSGILSIGLAQLGAQVLAVEVDSLAVDNALENAALNEVESQIHFSDHLPKHSVDSSGNDRNRFRLIVANILKPVLLEVASSLVDRLEEDGILILSGLIEADVAPVLDCYERLLGKKGGKIFTHGEWRALVFERSKTNLIFG